MDEIRTERRGRVLWVTIDRPEARNAMKFAMYDRLAELCDEIDADAELRAVVLTGAGDRAFISGTDISEFRVFAHDDDALAYEGKIGSLVGRLEAVRIPVIAAIRGACTGGGMSIAAACDLRIASPDSRFGFPVARTLGNCLSVANIARLIDLVGPAAVKEMVYLARLIDAPRAAAVGFLNAVVAGDALHAHVAELAETIAANAPLTIRATKEALRRIAAEGRGAPDRDLILSCYMSNDFREGMTAFFEKRPAKWTGT
jgi:enoyl-CoA hydratase/carnithine racemase